MRQAAARDVKPGIDKVKARGNARNPQAGSGTVSSWRVLRAYNIAYRCFKKGQCVAAASAFSPGLSATLRPTLRLRACAEPTGSEHATEVRERKSGLAL